MGAHITYQITTRLLDFMVEAEEGDGSSHIAIPTAP